MELVYTKKQLLSKNFGIIIIFSLVILEKSLHSLFNQSNHWYLNSRLCQLASAEVERQKWVTFLSRDSGYLKMLLCKRTELKFCRQTYFWCFLNFGPLSLLAWFVFNTGFWNFINNKVIAKPLSAIYSTTPNVHYFQWLN